MKYYKYEVLNIEDKLFSDLNLNDTFFDSLKKDYPGFINWFNKKIVSNERVYTYKNDCNNIEGMLYLKVENSDEKYDFSPNFLPKKRLKIGTFKISKTGYKMSERFLKIIFDNALLNKVEEIYVTIFENDQNKLKLIEILKLFGFEYWGKKNSNNESIFIKKMLFNKDRTIQENFPNYNFENSSYYLLPIKPEFHTNLLPDCILKTEAPNNFRNSESWQYAIKKIYIGDNIFQSGVKEGDALVFYRTKKENDAAPAAYKSVLTGIGVILKKGIFNNLSDLEKKSLISRSVFKIEEINKFKNPYYLEFLFLNSFNKRLTLRELRRELNIFNGPENWGPRGLYKIDKEKFKYIISKTMKN